MSDPADYGVFRTNFLSFLHRLQQTPDISPAIDFLVSALAEIQVAYPSVPTLVFGVQKLLNALAHSVPLASVTQLQALARLGDAATPELDRRAYFDELRGLLGPDLGDVYSFRCLWDLFKLKELLEAMPLQDLTLLFSKCFVRGLRPVQATQVLTELVTLCRALPVGVAADIAARLVADGPVSSAEAEAVVEASLRDASGHAGAYALLGGFVRMVAHQPLPEQLRRLQSALANLDAALCRLLTALSFAFRAELWLRIVDDCRALLPSGELAALPGAAGRAALTSTSDVFDDHSDPATLAMLAVNGTSDHDPDAADLSELPPAFAASLLGLPTSDGTAGAPGEGLRVQIVEQPPEKSVYKRNLKPNPAVMIVGGGTGGGADEQLYVVPLLVRCDTLADEPRFLTGATPQRAVPGQVVTFKKLKVTTTSHQQHETLFTLRFELRRYRRGPSAHQPQHDDYDTLHEQHSSPIAILSHSTQLKPLPSLQPSISDLVPSRLPCTGGSRMAILGRDFVESPTLMVRIGGAEMAPVFHGPGTLIVHVPPGPDASRHTPVSVSVQVCNAFGKWTTASTPLTYHPTRSSPLPPAASVAPLPALPASTASTASSPAQPFDGPPVGLSPSATSAPAAASPASSTPPLLHNRDQLRMSIDPSFPPSSLLDSSVDKSLLLGLGQSADPDWLRMSFPALRESLVFQGHGLDSSQGLGPFSEQESLLDTSFSASSSWPQT
eukprot:TRINITY_DN6812_c0_g1_i2.p1 TRINITY_DN6812_c0_g1~~TRINITY_DN6812_c0_g1_i2.p1  ORF type:complete len:758 (-),score=235.05 TRINITY_DN6812_c0_g1_i2:662-2836(-)